MLEMVSDSLTSSQLCGLKRFGSRVNKFCLDFAVCNAGGELVLFCPGGKNPADGQSDKPYMLCAKRCIEKDDGVYRFGENEQILATVLKSNSEIVGVALVDLGDSSECTTPGEFHDRQYHRCSTILCEMLDFLAEDFQARTKNEKQVELVSAELAQVYEELVLLHKLSTNMRVNESDINYLQMACDNLTDIVGVGGIAILLDRTIDDEKKLVLSAGSGLIDIDEGMAVILRDRLAEEIKSGREALLDSEVDSPFRYDWPQNIKNIIAVPLYGKDKTEYGVMHETQDGADIIGLMVAIDRVDRPDFDSTDVKLFNSVANSCAVFIENSKLFDDLKDLFIGSLKALTSSIDAKDQYTRGHSERVALISRWIAERLVGEQQLSQEDIYNIYLAGLLHDIGKVGISEKILRKQGRLNEEEISQIRTHPEVGAGILGQIKQMRDVVPAVLHHHERVDGKGYPNGLADEEISLIGKIVGLADSFDAMTSKRTYRSALTIEQALAEIKEGLGTQFDEKIGSVFINSDVYRLWDIIQDGFAEVHRKADFSEYGNVAVGTLIR